MEHSLSALDPAIRPWRTATLVATAVAAAELVLLVVAGGALLARHATAPVRHSTHARAAAAASHTLARHRPPAVHRAVPARLERRQVSVLVLNGNGRHGAAAAAARRVRSHGYRIGGVGNAGRMDYGKSMVMYRPGFEGEGRRLARDLGIRIVGPLDGIRAPQLHGAKAVLVLGA